MYLCLRHSTAHLVQLASPIKDFDLLFSAQEGLHLLILYPDACLSLQPFLRRELLLISSELLVVQIRTVARRGVKLLQVPVLEAGNEFLLEHVSLHLSLR